LAGFLPLESWSLRKAGSDNRCVDLFHFSQPCSLWSRATRRSVSLLWLCLPRLLRLYARPPAFEHSSNEWQVATPFPPFGISNHGRNNRSSVASMSVSCNQRLQRTWPSFSVSIVAGMSGVPSSAHLPIPKAGHAAEAQCYTPLGGGGGE
jgi:hypothetical protein